MFINETLKQKLAALIRVHFFENMTSPEKG